MHIYAMIYIIHIITNAVLDNLGNMSGKKTQQEKRFQFCNMHRCVWLLPKILTNRVFHLFSFFRLHEFHHKLYTAVLCRISGMGTGNSFWKCYFPTHIRCLNEQNPKPRDCTSLGLPAIKMFAALDCCIFYCTYHTGFNHTN